MDALSVLSVVVYGGLFGMMVVAGLIQPEKRGDDE